MLVVGLTGGVGSGKSSVADLMAASGAIVIDADVIARRVVEPHTGGYEAVVGHFGPDVVASDRSLDRGRLAEIIFNDEDERNFLNSVIHPLVRKEISLRVDELRFTDSVALLVIPLLVESGNYQVDRLVVVDCEEHIAVSRLINDRGWSELQARQRIASQISRADRVAAADYVIDNNGDVDELEERVTRCWAWLTEA